MFQGWRIKAMVKTSNMTKRERRRHSEAKRNVLFTETDRP